MRTETAIRRPPSRVDYQLQTTTVLSFDRGGGQGLAQAVAGAGTRFNDRDPGAKGLAAGEVIVRDLLGGDQADRVVRSTTQCRPACRGPVEGRTQPIR